ncbi:hypothetical protein J4P02_01275 [Pseudomonas sp. NFXW11]|uniref:hypothetical protein n=1 Tax=Pseudomonas sp. NFXW11 TaxID=2819531 RepID=UPI003CEABB46
MTAFEKEAFILSSNALLLGAILDKPADISLTRAYERIQALLGDDVRAKNEDADAPAGNETSSFVDLIETKASSQELVDKILGWVSAAREMARRANQQMADFLKIVNKIRLSAFILSHLEHFDLHALLTRIRNFLGLRACIRVPLFEYGAELCEYRHRFR